MIFYIILIGVIILGIILKATDILDDSALVMIILGGIFLISTFTIHLSCYYDGGAKIQEYNILKEMYEDLDPSNMIDATTKRDIIDFNRKLAQVKYWNNSICDIFIMDEYANLPYLSMED